MRLTFNNNYKWKASLRYYSSSISFNDEEILNIDKEGRIISFIINNGTKNKVTYKKAFNGTWMGVKRESLDQERIRFEVEDKTLKDLLQNSISPFIVKFLEVITNSIITREIIFTFDHSDVLQTDNQDTILNNWIKILKKVNYEKELIDKVEFANIYSHVGILPPDMYGSLVIQVTRGCVYNKCSFCKLYDGIEYSHSSQKEIKDHIVKIKQFMGESLGRFHSIFLGDANALTIPFEELKKILNIINEEFIINLKKESPLTKNNPTFQGIYSFLDVFTGYKLEKEHYEYFFKSNIKMIYLGVESGSEQVLKILNKPNKKNKLLSIVENLHAVNIGVSVIFLIGAGGKFYEQEHVNESIKLIKEMNLGPNDLIYLSKLVTFMDSNYFKLVHKQDLQLLTEKELLNQEKEFKNGISRLYNSNENKHKPKIATYEIKDFIY